MNYYVEIHTQKFDGGLVIWRKKVSTPEYGRDLLFQYSWSLFGSDTAQLMNDFGEEVTLHVKKYGRQAQIKEGVFVL